ncbi:MAG TPA: ribonuclease Z [Candidatus Atribacteria bacterium]|nr:ribonuclease Z [Candidatus Atribacteria bacterium]
MKPIILYSEAGIATQIVISAEGNHYMVDSGDGTLRDLLNQKIDFKKIRGIFLTHGHYDHLGGLYSLLGHFRVIERKDPINIYFPEGCREALQIIYAFQQSYKDCSFKINVHEVSDQEEIKLKNVKVKVYKMRHYASVGVNRLLHPDPAVGYRFIYQGKSVAISGDTGICSGLKKLVQDADLALIDSTLDKNEENDELLEKLHLSREKAEEIGKLAKKFIPIHQHKR